MIRLTNTESVHIKELLDCVSEAIERTEGVSPQYANKTKLQKILYFGIKEYTLPITYSWYLAGAVVPDTGVSPAGLATPQSPQSTQPTQSPLSDHSTQPSDVSDDSRSAIRESVDTKLPDVDPIMFSDTGDSTGDSVDSIFEIVDRSTLIDFYTTKIPDVWSQSTMRFLQNFYQETAPPEYRSLYIESTHLRTHLNELVESVEAHRSGQEPTSSVSELEVQLGWKVSDLHYYLRDTEQLRETFDLVVKGTDLIEDAASTLTAIDPDEYTQEHVNALNELQDFFYYYVWRYPCLRISALTATGPSADVLVAQQQRTYETFPERFQNKYIEYADIVRDAGLYPDPVNPIESEDDEVDQTLTDLSMEYLG